MDDDKIFLETDLLYAKYKIGFAMVGADGKSHGEKKRLEQPHLKPGAVKSGGFQMRMGWNLGALTQEKMKGL